ncbi:zinc finger, CCHC-type containing protein [Tanacetum coccineum]
MLTACYLLNRVPNKSNKITPYELWTKRKSNLNYFRVWGRIAVIRLPNPKLKTLGERGIKFIFVGYADHSKAFRFYVIETNESVLINSIIESRDAIFDKNRFSSVLRPSQRSLINGTKDIGGLVVLEEITKEVLADLPLGCKPLGYKWILKRKLKVDGSIEKFKARLVIQGFRQKSRIDYFDTYALVARLKEAPKQWNQKFDEVVLSNGYILNQADNCVYRKFDESDKGVIICLYVYDMMIFGSDQVQVDLTKEFLSSSFSMKDMGEADLILCIRIKHEMSTPIDTSEKLMPNNGQVVSQLEYSRVIGCLMYAITCTRPDIAFVVGKLSRYTSNISTQHWQSIQRASKKQNCIIRSTMEYEFVALAAASKEAEWLKNLILKISLWSKPIAPISIYCEVMIH